MGRSRALVGALAVVAGVLAACADPIAGTASPVPQSEPTRPAQPASDPCSLLTAQQAQALGLVPEGRFREGDPVRRLPPSCRWVPTPESSASSLTVAASTDLSLEEYTQADTPVETFESGGLTWVRYPGPLSELSCFASHKLSAKSFVTIIGGDASDQDKRCAPVKTATELVAAQLPGGDPNPKLPERPAKHAASPLDPMEPCSVLSPEQLAKLGVSAEGRKTGKGRSEGSDSPPGCEWEQVADKNRRLLYVLFGLDRSAADLAYRSDPTGQLKVGERTWTIYAGYTGNEKACALILPVTKTSAVKITGGNNKEPAKACDQLKQAATLMTPRIPTG